MNVRLSGAALALAVLSPTCFASAGGATGYTLRDQATSCGSCHGASNAAMTVAFAGPSAMLPGQTVVWTANVSGPANASALAGFAAAIQKKAQQPTFSSIAGQPTVTSDGSTTISHGNSQGALDGFAGGSAQYTVNLTMPGNAVLGTTYSVYMSANVGHGGDQVGWKAATTTTLTVGAPTPTSITPNQAAATDTAIPLAWAGTQGEEFRVIYKTGSAPTGPNDGTLVYQGANTSASATGLTGGTLYYFAAFGKVPNQTHYSATAAQATAATLPPNPTGMTAMSSSSSEIALTWTGTAAEFIVRGKAGAYPAGPTDASAELVYQGTAKNTVDAGLSAGTQYYYRVWGRTPNSTAYSAMASQATATTASQPLDRHVAADGSDQGGANPCTVLASPCRSITRAMTVAGGGDSIFVQPGTYSAAGGEVFPIAFKPGVQLIATGSPADTFIDGAGDPVQQGLIELAQNGSTLTRLQGFTLRNGLRTVPLGYVSVGGALYVEYGQPGSMFTVTGNVFENNEARGHSANDVGGNSGGSAWGGAIGTFSARMTITNNVFVGNIARAGNGADHPATPVDNNENGGGASGGAVYYGGTGTIANNTFVGNVAQGGDGGLGSDGRGAAGWGQGGGLDAGGNPAPAIINNIFFANVATVGLGSTSDASLAGGLTASQAPLVDRNLFFGNLVDGAPSASDDLGTDPVLADPKFHSPTLLRLRNSSPARAAGGAAGAPTIDFEELLRPDPPSIGAYEAGFLSQTLQFGPAPVVSAGGTDAVTVVAGASSSPVVVTSQTPAICTVAGGVVTGVTAGTCTLIANQAADVDYTAAPQVSQSFQVLAQPVFELAVTRSGTGSGSVTSNPAGILCGPDCEANFAVDTVVTLTATAHAGSVFLGWGGACSNAAQASCQVTMSQARSVSAMFGPDAQQAVRVFVDGFEQ
jgi:hypothetical protein